MPVKAYLTADSGTCRGIKKDNTRCTNPAKVDGFCGVHAGQAVAKPGTPAKQQGSHKAVLGPGQWGKCQGVTENKCPCPNNAMSNGYCTVHVGQAIKPKPVAAAKPVTPDYGKCKGVKNDGDRCTNNAHATGFCKVHEAQATKPKLVPPPKPSTSAMVTRSKAAAKLAKADKRLLPTGDSVTNAMGSSTRSDLPSAKAHWINCAGPWPAMCCAHQCTRAADRGGHVFITGKFMTVYLVPVCAAHNAVKQNFRVNAGTIAVEDPTVSVLGIGCMGWKHLIAKNFTLAL